MELIPGDLATTLLGARATQERLEKVRQQLHLDEPLPSRYFQYLTGLVQGDLGDSIPLGRPVAEVVGHKFTVTVVIALSAFLVSVLLGIPLGLIAGVKHMSMYDRAVMVIATLGLSIPAFWMGLNLIIIFSIWLKWLPSGGFVPFSESFVGAIRHLLLPAATLGFLSTAEIARMTRAKTLEVIREDYVRTARAKGLREIAIIGKHVFRNIAVLLMTVLGMRLGRLLAGAVVTEQVFRVPGLGMLIISSLEKRDYLTVQGVLLVMGATFMVLNLLVDLSYAYLDPRIKYD